MKNVRDLTREELLAIPADEPERLFPNSSEEIKQQFRQLAAKWHPDRCTDPKAADVFAHVKSLREEADRRVSAGSWTAPNSLNFKALDGREFNATYLHKAPFELGMMYVASSHVTYVVSKDYRDLYQNGVAAIKALKFANPDMEKEMRRVLPRIKAEFETKDACVLVLSKEPDQVRLSDVLANKGGRIDAKQTAWILSHLYNTACYLGWAKMTHNDMSPDTLFVSPQNHGGALLGGWWYATGAGHKLRALPTRTMELAPSDILRTLKADARVDLELIRATGRELLGDPRGSTLSWSKEVPKPLADWLRAPTSGPPLAEYRSYKDHVLPKSFGSRRFEKWDIKATDIYKPRSM